LAIQNNNNNNNNNNYCLTRLGTIVKSKDWMVKKTLYANSPKEADNKLHQKNNNKWQMRNPKADKYLMCCSFTNGTRSTSQKRIQLFAKLIKNPPPFPPLFEGIMCLLTVGKVNPLFNI
jgi:hypothetical protein